jgi:urease gamma subunit
MSVKRAAKPPPIPGILSAEVRAAEVLRIADALQGRLVADIMQSSQNQIERNDMVAGVLAVVLRRLVGALPAFTDRELWVSEIVKAVFR